MTLQYFVNSNLDIQELKNQYKTLAKKYHPDLGGSNEAMKIINLEYEFLFNLISKGSGASTSTEEFELEKEFMDVIQKISILNGIIIELIGKWIWVSGNTILHKDVLKSFGLKWSRNKQMWYWNNEKGYRRTSNYSIDEIRVRYGTKVMNREFKTCLG
jgi:hypothetical protein